MSLSQRGYQVEFDPLHWYKRAYGEPPENLGTCNKLETVPLLGAVLEFLR